MDIGGLGGVTSAYQYANQIRNKSVSSSDFASSLNKATSSDNVVEAYKNSLQSKFGCPITVASVGKDQNSMDRFAGGTAGSGNVAIAPNILEQMTNDPEKAAYYEKKISDYYNYGIANSQMAAAAIGHRVISDGLIIHEDGTVTHYTSIEEDPKEVAKFEAEQKAKREKKAKERQESIERSQEAADERRRIQEESYHRKSIEAILHEQMLGAGTLAFGDTPESVLAVYGAGTSIPNGSDL
ncbi:MAG: hypothetical protein IJ683_04645 [Butyrivibrio sp.]|nr:DUF6033 family protein [Butyrivibrio sp.]MBR1641595.1 hypothetical protein [Butyrivibrio sp.]